MAAKFPTVEDARRIATASHNNALYDGDHHQEFGIKDYFTDQQEKEKKLYIAVNLPAIICEYFADMVAGDGVLFDVQDNDLQAKINDIAERNDLDVAIFEASVNQSNHGYTAIRVRKDPVTEKAVIEEIPVDQYFPQYTSGITKTKTGDILASYVKLVKPGSNKADTYLYKEVYTMVDGKLMLEYQLWSIDHEKRQDERVPLSWYSDALPEKPQDTGFEDWNIHLINNIKKSGQVFGKSDLKDPEPLMQELNDRVTQISVQLIKHMNARVAVPQGTLDENGEVRASEADMIEVGSGEMIPQYIENSNPQIEMGFKQIDGLLRKIAAMTKIPVDVFGVDAAGGGAEKVEAMRIRMFNTIRKINRKRTYMEATLKKIVKQALLVEDTTLEVGEGDEVQTLDITIRWSDVLPVDEYVRTQTLQMQTASGLKSKRKAVKELQEIDDEDLEEELNEIKGESTPEVPRFSDTPRVPNLDDQ